MYVVLICSTVFVYVGGIYHIPWIRVLIPRSLTDTEPRALVSLIAITTQHWISPPMLFIKTSNADNASLHIAFPLLLSLHFIFSVPFSIALLAR
jgi:hypothetical protein